MTLLVSQRKEAEPQLLWNVYYHLFLDEETVRVLEAHLARLLAASTSVKDWKESDFGENFRFCNASTLSYVRHVWHAYAECLEKKDQDQYRADFDAAVRHSHTYKDTFLGGDATVAGSLHAAAPLGLQVSKEMKIALKSWWEKGTTGLVPANTNVPNPLFSATLSRYSVLPPGADPILSYHLATASVHLTGQSDSQADNGHDNPSSLAFVAAAQGQFAEWSRAFVEMASRDMTLRFVAADGLSFCHTLQHHIETCQLSGQFYRRQLSMERLELDPDEYGLHSKTPKQFDVIDTSDTSESLGALNVLISGSPLLKAAPWATLFIEINGKRTEGEKAMFKELLCGSTRISQVFLGSAPWSTGPMPQQSRTSTNTC